jgi:hypothetical protein
MTTIAEDRIRDALARACNIGFVEERFTVMGCSIVMRNLKPEEYQSVVDETRDLKDVEFAYAYQMGHVSRAIIEVGDLDLREVEYIETDVPDPKNSGQKKTVNLERHDWLRKKVLSTWGREALSTLYRKFADVLQKADDKSVEGVQFVVPDETAEDKYRRLIGELKEAEETLPDELVQRILQDNGYSHQITVEELAAAQAKLGGGEIKKEAEAAVVTAKLEPSVAEALRTPEGRAAVAEAVGPASPDLPGSEGPRPDPRELMLRRKPLNVEPQVPQQTALSPKAREYAALEAQAELLNGPGSPPQPTRPQNVPELSRPMDRTPTAVVVDPPPPAGINPRFRPPPRQP